MRRNKKRHYFPYTSTSNKYNRIEIDSRFLILLSAATQTKYEKTISDLYFYFLSEYRKKKPNSLFIRQHCEKKIKDKKDNADDRRDALNFTYKVCGVKILITATIVLNFDKTSDFFSITFRQGSINNSDFNKKFFNLKDLEDKFLIESLFKE